MPLNSAVLVKVSRAGGVESRHLGHAVIADRQEMVLRRAAVTAKIGDIMSAEISQVRRVTIPPEWLR